MVYTITFLFDSYWSMILSCSFTGNTKLPLSISLYSHQGVVSQSLTLVLLFNFGNRSTSFRRSVYLVLKRHTLFWEAYPPRWSLLWYIFPLSVTCGGTWITFAKPLRQGYCQRDNNCYFTLDIKVSAFPRIYFVFHIFQVFFKVEDISRDSRPRVWTGSRVHLNSNRFGLGSGSDPKNLAVVLSTLTRSPEQIPDFSNSCRACDRVAWSLRKHVLSSAIWVISISCLFMIVPLMSLFLRILAEKASAASTNRYGDNGHPCLTPRCKGGQEDMWPLLATVAVISAKECMIWTSARSNTLLNTWIKSSNWGNQTLFRSLLKA